MLKNKPSQFLIYGLLIGAVIGMMFFDNLAMGAGLGMVFGLGNDTDNDAGRATTVVSPNSV